MLAYGLPSLEIVSASVARATDGAAPNNPAKLVGLKSPPTVAKSDTINPPIRNRASASVNVFPNSTTITSSGSLSALGPSYANVRASGKRAAIRVPLHCARRKIVQARARATFGQASSKNLTTQFSQLALSSYL
jgi:hypothetical protein